ncbi:MAG: hypothetical protein E7020_02050 [Alphaproteobacteria bacterium]|nr:hypothetical protein [Alphaproteobacteria bacterium]
MDDIHLEDPRKFSAKQIKKSVEEAKYKRTFWQYCFDLIVKTILLATIISLDFTLFANAGSYNLFSSSAWLNIEAQYIYIAIAVFSFLFMFIASFFRALENFILSLAFAVLSVALINQFATFEKKSALLILFNGVFSDSVNTIIYEYSSWIVGAVVFILSWLLLKLLSRQFMLYFTLLFVALLGWVFSEAYLNNNTQYFRDMASIPTLKNKDKGKNLVFLSFNNLTTPNNLRNMYYKSKQHPNIQGSFYNALGFYTKNNFILYPNAAVNNPEQPFYNLIASYNPNSKDNISDLVLSSSVRGGYFDFTALQNDRLYMAKSSLYDMLKKDGYFINVYQTRDIDTCYVNGKLVATSCKEKVNLPISFNNGYYSTTQKVILLTSQWLKSTGIVSSMNPVLAMLKYVYPDPDVIALPFEVDKLYTVNSFKVFDQIIDSIDRNNGNQAYFAVIDLPSETYVYDEFCKIKDMSQWQSENMLEFARTPVDKRRSSYADQVSCLYGSLEKFVQQLDKGGHLEDTTIVIQGINNPLGLASNDRDFYRKIQEKSHVALAIKPAKASKPKVDYSVCDVTDILDSYFIGRKPCKDFGKIKTTDKIMKAVKNTVEQDKYKKHEITAAQNNFNQWFTAWKSQNEFGNMEVLSFSEDSKPNNEPEKIEEDIKVVAESKVTETIVEDVPEVKMESIRVASDNEETAKNSDIEDVKEDIVKETDSKIVVDNLPKENANTDEAPIETKTGTEELVEELTFEKVKVLEDPVVDNDITVPEIELEDITEAEDKPESDVNIVEEVVPDVVVEEVDDEQQLSDADIAIARAKQRLADKLAKEKAENNSPKTVDDLVGQVPNEALRNVLEAPVAEGQKLSPEELKRQYREALKKANQASKADINIEVKVIER